jgi:hypothetical protein
LIEREGKTDDLVTQVDRLDQQGGEELPVAAKKQLA